MKTKARLIASLKIWVVIYPSITLFLFLFGTGLASLPLYQRTFILTFILVPWIVLPGYRWWMPCSGKFRREIKKSTRPDPCKQCNASR